jgi:hypothetical protein
MKKILLTATSGLALLTASSVSAQDAGAPRGVASSHKPNEHTVACLQALSCDCSISAAMQTVIAEELGLERAKVLVGVARSLIAIGDNARATQTLNLALEEARSVRLTLITQEKIKEIAPLLARAGDLVNALTLAAELQIDSVRDKALAAIAAETAKGGDLAGAKQAIEKMQNRVRAFWERADAFVVAPSDQITAADIAGFEEQVRLLDKAEAKYRGIAYLAVIADKMGDTVRRDALLAEADELFPAVIGVSQRARVTLQRLQAMKKADLDDALVQASYELAALHGSRLRGSEIADFALEIGAIEAQNGLIANAVGRLPVFQKPEEKAEYISRLVNGDGSDNGLSLTYAATLDELSAIEGVYERDLARLTLLEGAIANKSRGLAVPIIEALEDDDNQALGLALLASIIE